MKNEPYSSDCRLAPRGTLVKKVKRSFPVVVVPIPHLTTTVLLPPPLVHAKEQQQLPLLWQRRQQVQHHQSSAPTEQRHPAAHILPRAQPVRGRVQ
jgi:hypothetical protein